MKKSVALALLSLVLATGCQRSSSQSWEDVKTAGRQVTRGIDNAVGKGTESWLVENEGDFVGPSDANFIPLTDSDLRMQFKSTDLAVAQPKYSPGQKGIPELDKFSSPSGALSSIFQTLHFETDDHILREREDLMRIRKIADFMKKHPYAYLAVEGHCDERASAAYNMALGTRRANHVRVLLIKDGVDPNHVYTVSYGKERPISMGHGSSDWIENRRAEFKIYEKN